MDIKIKLDKNFPAFNEQYLQILIAKDFHILSQIIMILLKQVDSIQFE